MLFSKYLKGEEVDSDDTDPIIDEETEVPVLSTNGNVALAGIELFHYCKITIERYKDKLEITKNPS